MDARLRRRGELALFVTNGQNARAVAQEREVTAAIGFARLEPVSDVPAGPPGEAPGVGSRTDLVRRAALLGGGVLAAGGAVAALADGADSSSSDARDVRILNFVLRLERLKGAYYRDAAAGGALSGELQQLAEILARHEREHVSFLRDRLGANAERERRYDFGDATRDADTFAATTRALEEAAVAGYIGQGANLTRPLMVPFAQLCSVEARHAAWIADVLDGDPAPSAADEAKTAAEVLAMIDETGLTEGT